MIMQVPARLSHYPQINSHLVGGFIPCEKILVKPDHVPKDQGETKRMLGTTT